MVSARRVSQEAEHLKAGVLAVAHDNVIEHVQSHRRTIREIGRVLRPGGLAYLSFPNLLSPDNFRRDPHYNLFGVSVMPPWLGRWYVVNLRQRALNFGVGYFPVASLLKHWLQQAGLTVVEQEPEMRRTFGTLTGLLRGIRTNTLAVVTWILKR